MQISTYFWLFRKNSMFSCEKDAYSQQFTSFELMCGEKVALLHFWSMLTYHLLLPEPQQVRTLVTALHYYSPLTSLSSQQ